MKSKVKNKYSPDRWVLIKVDSGYSSYYRVMACWHGGYARGDSWRINSGITKIENHENAFIFHGSSGSVYRCDKIDYGLSTYGQNILDRLIFDSKKSKVDITVVPEDQIESLIV